MSGGHFPYPKRIWTPTGGWWFTPSNYKSNVVIICGTAAIIAFGSFKLAQRAEYNPKTEYDEAVIDSWNAAAGKGIIR